MAREHVMDLGRKRRSNGDGEPIEVRASHLKDVIAGLERRGPALVHRIDTAHPRALASIQSATRAEWLPFELSMDVTRSLDQVAGRDETRAIYLEACLSSFRSGTLAPLFSSALRLFGPAPHRIARFIPWAWSAVWRGCGELVVEEARPGLVRVGHRGLPPDAMVDMFQDVCATCIGSIIAACGKRGGGSVDRRSDRDPIGYLLQWDDI
jgi:hypothetical protein